MKVKPLKFVRNRVWRAYRGGAGIDRLHGVAGEDDHFPEDWIASCVEANNPQYDCPGQGLSRICDGGAELPFRSVLETDPEGMLGAEHVAGFGAVPGFLMKILDSAERLPIQVHPSVPDARRIFDSRCGKTECWVVIATREIDGEPPYLLLGFNGQLDRERFLAEARRGVFEQGGAMLHRFAVTPGDVFLVPGGTPHAIGSGVTVIEVMEPSDLVVQPELACGAQPLTTAERFSGAEPERALEAFHFHAETAEELLRRCRPVPETIATAPDGSRLDRVMPLSVARLFEVQKLHVNGCWHFVNRERCCRAGVVVAGEAVIEYGGETLPIGCGESFFLPCGVETCTIRGNAEIVFALPPDRLEENR